jgi:hypothetical protein
MDGGATATEDLLGMIDDSGSTRVAGPPSCLSGSRCGCGPGSAAGGGPRRPPGRRARCLRRRWVAVRCSPAQALAIQRFIDAWNDRCAPFTWTKDPDTVIAKAPDPRRRKTQASSVTEH